jgi:short-subunit dehydrogenase
MKKAIVIGASSGIGRELSKVLANNGYEVGIAARRLEELQSLQNEITSKTWIKQIDLEQIDASIASIEELIKEMGGLNLFVINAGVNHFIHNIDWEKEKQILTLNVLGFSAMANIAMRIFLKEKKGHLVGIS